MEFQCDCFYASATHPVDPRHYIFDLTIHLRMHTCVCSPVHAHLRVLTCACCAYTLEHTRVYMQAEVFSDWLAFDF